jgi:hypothetical protein
VMAAAPQVVAVVAARALDALRFLFFFLAICARGRHCVVVCWERRKAGGCIRDRFTCEGTLRD